VLDTVSRPDLASGQAAGLLTIGRKLIRVLPVTFAARGAGHTSCVVNLAAALSSIGLRVVVIDAGRTMVAPALGLKAKYELLHLLSGERTFPETVLKAPEFLVLPATKGLDEFIQSGSPADDLFGAFGRLSTPVDLVLVATSPTAIAKLLGRSSDVLFVQNDDPESIKATYTSLKKLSEDHGCHRFRILINNVEQDAKAHDGYARLADTAARYFHAHLALAGVVPKDPMIKRATAALGHVFRGEANPAKSAFLRIAVDIANWQLAEFSELSD